MYHSNSRISPSFSNNHQQQGEFKSKKTLQIQAHHHHPTSTIFNDEILDQDKQYTSTAKPYELQKEEEKETGDTNNDSNTISSEIINPFTIDKAFHFVLNKDDLNYYVESYSLVIQSITSK